ncbi:MAG TPA: hypothetical protein VK338_01505 [Candidatus Nitrosocosmicus sp.]|nr:hypothetical protein [Candidatus Nitrosocosmicus sp.]
MYGGFKEMKEFDISNPAIYENAFNFMKRYIQNKHLNKVLNTWGIKKTRRLQDMHEEIIDRVRFGLIDIKDFSDWLSISQIDGNNYHFVYDVDFIKTKEKVAKEILENSHHVTENILTLNPDSINQTTLINVFKLQHKYVFVFLSPAEIALKREYIDGSYSYINKKIVYPSIVECDFKNNTVNVILNPTTGLVHVDNVSQGKYSSFSPIADLYLEKTKELLGNFIINKPEWLPKAFFEFAEELSAIKDPKIQEVLRNMDEKIRDFSKDILEENNIIDIALKDSFYAEIQDSFITVLQEEYGIEGDYEDPYRVYFQKTDQATSSIAVESKTNILTNGTTNRIAKQSRQDSDLKVIGLEYRPDEHNLYRFRIEDGVDHILIKPSNRFTEEEVVQNVISKLREYKS